MARRTAVPPCTLVAGAVTPRMLRGPSGLLLRRSSRSLLGAVCFFWRANVVLRLLLRGPALAVSAGTMLLPAAITAGSATVPLLAIAALSVVFLPVLLLRGRSAGTFARRTLAVLVLPVTALAAVPRSLRAAVMRPCAGSALGPLELRFGPAEAPHLFEFRPGAFASFGSGFSRCLRGCGRFGSGIGDRCCGRVFDGVRFRRRGICGNSSLDSPCGLHFGGIGCGDARSGFFSGWCDIVVRRLGSIGKRC